MINVDFVKAIFSFIMASSYIMKGSISHDYVIKSNDEV